MAILMAHVVRSVGYDLEIKFLDMPDNVIVKKLEDLQNVYYLNTSFSDGDWLSSLRGCIEEVDSSGILDMADRIGLQMDRLTLLFAWWCEAMGHFNLDCEYEITFNFLRSYQASCMLAWIYGEIESLPDNLLKYQA